MINTARDKKGTERESLGIECKIWCNYIDADSRVDLKPIYMKVAFAEEPVKWDLESKLNSLINQMLTKRNQLKT